MMQLAMALPVRSGVGKADEGELWRRWREQGCRAAREALIALHMETARMLAARMYRGRHTDEIEFADYLQFALVGLIESVDRFDPARVVQFRTFALPRVNGAILNGVSQMTEKNEQIAMRQRLVSERSATLAASRGAQGGHGAAVFAELAEVAVGLALGFILDGTTMMAAEVEPALPAHAYDGLELRQLRARLVRMVGALPASERRVIEYHYFHQVPFERVADIMSLSKGRISQLHKRALGLLRAAALDMDKCDLAW